MAGTRGIRYLIDKTLGMELVIAAGTVMRYPPHTHVSTHTVLLVRRGRVQAAVGGKKRVLRAGDCLVLPPHRLHSLAAHCRHETLSLCVDCRAATANLGGIAAALSRLAERGVLHGDEPGRLLACLQSVSRPDEPKDALSRLKDTLLENPEGDVDLADMAAAVHVGKYHLIRLFKKRYGLTPRGFLTQSRVRKARGRMADRVSLTGVALQAGFYDQSHFIRHFKRLQGMSPSRYLRCRGVLPS